MQIQAFFVIGLAPDGQVVGHSEVPMQHMDATLAAIEKLKFSLLAQEARNKANQQRIVGAPAAPIPGLRA